MCTVRGSRSLCATGYVGVLCSVCAPGYFSEYGSCFQCPTAATPTTTAATVGLPLALVVVFALLFMVRHVAPDGMMKVGVTMFQVLASANNVYRVPWPTVGDCALSFLLCGRPCPRR